MDIFRFRIKCHFLYPMRIHINKFNELKTARIFKWWLMVTHKHYTPCVLYSRSILLWLDTESEQKRVKVTCVYFQWHTHTKKIITFAIDFTATFRTVAICTDDIDVISLPILHFTSKWLPARIVFEKSIFFSHVEKYNCRNFLQIIVVFGICMMRRRMRLRSDVVKWFNFSFWIFDFSL